MEQLPPNFRDDLMRRMLSLKPIVEEAMRIVEHTLGPEHHEVLSLLIPLAQWYQETKHYGEAERTLIGQPAGPAAFRAAAEDALAGAMPRGHNAFKIELAKRTLVRALSRAGASR